MGAFEVLLGTLALHAAVGFEEALASTFLSGLWAQGALAGGSAADAFSVSIGLGKTMTATDILNGIMNVVIKVAVTHPAEFIVITISQQMQKA